MSQCDTTARPEIQRDELLKPYTTFKIGGPAKYFANVGNRNILGGALAFRRAESLELFVLGGGSNILVSDTGFAGLVVHPATAGTAIEEQNAEGVTLHIDAAETWDDVVAYAVKRGWWGIENLSHIPGQAAAALVQNVGAYGQQISDVVLNAEVVDIATGALSSLESAACGFGYRSSIFNTTRKGQLIIMGLTLRLRKHGVPNLRYPDVRAYFESRRVREPALDQIREAIIEIRDRKFPFPREERGGNAGSFFKNLLLNPAEYERLTRNLTRRLGPQAGERLRAVQSGLPSSPRLKVPTAFLIEICGLKGYRTGRAKVNESQPLVLLNEGGATAEDVLSLARQIRRTVYSHTGIAIELEPELVGFSPDELKKYMALE